MPPIETIARPYRNRISVSVPKEYSSYSFQVILVPIEGESKFRAPVGSRSRRKNRPIAESLLLCPKLGCGESLDVSRDVDVPSAFDRAGCFESEEFA